MFETSVGAKPRSYAWYEVWKHILFHPTQATFLRILADPKASARRAYIWVAIAGGLASAGSLALVSALAAIIGLLFHAWASHLIAKWCGGKGTGKDLV